MTQSFKVFIDGEAGTTGLQIRQRLDRHPNIEVISIDQDKRKDLKAKKTLLASIDVCILCLPDEAAIEAAKLCNEMNVRTLDASSAHRTADGWVYGLPELITGQREHIAKAQQVSNPGCYATGGNLILRALSEAKLLNDDYLVSINAVSGYSGGGKQMIASYETDDSTAPAFALYGLEFQHKHTPEIQAWSNLKRRPVFIPSVSAYDQGMLVHIMLDHHQLSTPSISTTDIHHLLMQKYKNEALITVHPVNYNDEATAPFLTPHGISGKNSCEIFCFGNEADDQTLLVAKLDNLGKGASGACVQNLNIMLGLDESIAVEI